MGSVRVEVPAASGNVVVAEAEPVELLLPPIVGVAVVTGTEAAPVSLVLAVAALLVDLVDLADLVFVVLVVDSLSSAALA